MRGRIAGILWVGVLVGTLLLTACSGTSGDSSAGSAAPEVGKLAPDFTLPLLEGGTVTLSSLRGKPVLLNFWATWCPPCREEMPYLQDTFTQKKEQGLVLLAVDIGENRDVVAQFVRQYGLTFPTPLDGSGDVARRYRVSAIPTSFLVDKDGVIRKIKVGAFSGVAEITEQLKTIIP